MRRRSLSQKENKINLPPVESVPADLARIAETLDAINNNLTGIYENLDALTENVTKFMEEVTKKGVTMRSR